MKHKSVIIIWVTVVIIGLSGYYLINRDINQNVCRAAQMSQ